MNIDQLRYFIDLSKTGSMNTTAKRMFISQPALSESIKRLEDELGCTLLLRSKTGVVFTDDGKMVLEYALRMLEQHDRMLQKLQIKYGQEQVEGKLSIGIGPTINDTFLPELLVKMHQTHPYVTLSVLEISADSMVDLLETDVINFGLVGILKSNLHTYDFQELLSDERFFIKQFSTDTVFCVMSKNHPLSVYESVSIAQLNDYKLTIYGNDVSYITDTDVLHISTNAKTHQQFMLNADTLCCMPYQTFLSLYSQKDFIAKPIIDSKPVTTYMVCKRELLHTHHTLYQAFIDTIISLQNAKTAY